MSPPGRPKGEYRRAQPEGTPMSAARPFRRRSFPTGHEGAPSGPWGTGPQGRRRQT
jgi:hypothetical protein